MKTAATPATAARTHVAVATCTGFPDVGADGPFLLAALAAAGCRVSVASWDDPGIDWAVFDAVLIRSTWDYVPRLADYLRWADSIGDRLVNPGAVVAWNTDKVYLGDLAAAGVPTVPTCFVPPGEAPDAPAAWTDLVVKPTVSAGAVRTGRFAGCDAAAVALVGAIHGSGRTAMLQPYQHRIEAEGELALIYLGGAFSHAVRKEALLAGRLGGEAEFHERLTPAEASAEHRAVADAALAAVPPGLGELTYARVDLVPGDDGPILLELELTEPSLFLPQAPDPAAAAGLLAQAVRRRALG